MFSKFRSRKPSLFVGAALFAFALCARAETIEVPVGSQGNDAPVKEMRGLKKEDVSALLGDPIGIQGPVGEPAITRWEYPGFYVYFERNVALHTVKKHNNG
ncbi:hypothetical protein [Microbulbifer hainanensis]|uniref:hypothetical protein n=1 Tax=Microbulbifer hainanensis TaxID=2735675 RepID=UPI0018671135|nr:hypothetical protein [Microbulbifer hainanensis]